MGTLLFEMLAGYPPFYDKVRQVMYRKILSAEFHAPDEVSADAADLCRRMLAREPTERLGYRGAAEVMRIKHSDTDGQLDLSDVGWMMMMWTHR